MTSAVAAADDDWRLRLMAKVVLAPDDEVQEHHNLQTAERGTV
jgi:hypothetical protein